MWSTRSGRYRWVVWSTRSARYSDQEVEIRRWMVEHISGQYSDVYITVIRKKRDCEVSSYSLYVARWCLCCLFL